MGTTIISRFELPEYLQERVSACQPPGSPVPELLLVRLDRDEGKLAATSLLWWALGESVGMRMLMPCRNRYSQMERNEALKCIDRYYPTRAWLAELDHTIDEILGKLDQPQAEAER